MNTEPRIYVACLASYNAGILHGKWIDATTDVDAMQGEINAILRASTCPNVTVPDYEAGAKEAGWTQVSSLKWEKTGAPMSIAGVDAEELCLQQGIAPAMVPSAEEWAIHDSEGLGNIGEYAGLAEVARRVEIIDAADDADIPASVLIEAMSDMGATDAADFLSDYYDGQADTWESFCEERFTDTGGLEGVPESLQCYIDFERMGRDWSLSGDWSAYRDGESGSLYFFRCH